MTTTAPTLPRLLALAALPLGLAAAALAQTATTPSYLPTKEETVHLEKFLVNDQRESSYASRRSVTATKTDIYVAAANPNDVIACTHVHFYV